jgi:hypothetical protein
LITLNVNTGVGVSPLKVKFNYTNPPQKQLLFAGLSQFFTFFWFQAQAKWRAEDKFQDIVDLFDQAHLT